MINVIIAKQLILTGKSEICDKLQSFWVVLPHLLCFTSTPGWFEVAIFRVLYFWGEESNEFREQIQLEIFPIYGFFYSVFYF
jgi:hypothetical protein